ncbi:di-heme oxidoreductase family protein [Sneathiella glossodoripedis]|uniref:di-heme oxidoreductase family protein n=1 Tax=Sneathiella glossodoripedis TaxID=418853 RepID=UPI00046EEC86|nr:di-heme oxidoredictase family protein [Sneathiella glossodoripedis]
MLFQNKIHLTLVLLVNVASSIAVADTPYRGDLTADELNRVFAVTKLTSDFSQAERFEAMSGGAATSSRSPDADAFSQFSANLGFEGEEKFKLGNGLFRKLWVSSPSSTQASDGLGPLFNARSCQRCHLKDGRGHPPEHDADSAVSMFLRLSVPPQSEKEKRLIETGEKQIIPEPTYGTQLQDLAIPGVPAEGKMKITYTEIKVALSGGEVISLRKPEYSIIEKKYGPLHPDVLISPRIAPPMVGLGLLEAIHDADILQQADPDDVDLDGISGRVSWVGYEHKKIGRFGWKASTASVLQQSADAFAGDIGISTPRAMRPWGDCTSLQTQCLNQPTGVQKNLGDSEAPDPVLELVTFYSSNLAVPIRRRVANTSVLSGKKEFYEIGCVKCHRPKFVTSKKAVQKEHRFQLIWPYTDLLLHDMGEGLADGRPVGSASRREWRTAPLWGIGLTKLVNGHTYFLHDGRARNLTEAILWHGGEAENSRQAFIELPPERRKNLIQFLESL